METPTFKQHQAYFTHGTNGMTGRRFTLAVVIRKGNTYLGIAECSEGDQFSRKIGRKLSESRAIHKPARQYFNDDSEDIKKKAIKLLH